MRYLKTYQLFETIKTLGLTNKQEEFLNKYTQGTWTYDPATGLVDVDGNFNCSGRRLKTLSGIKFGKVSGNFYVYGNSLTSLEGAPQEVGKEFGCNDNKLTSLEGAPQIVHGKFNCSRNELTSLNGSPQKVGAGFYCNNNSLTSLVEAPQKVGASQEDDGDFYCYDNSLTSLLGAPQKLSGDFYCYDNPLTSLMGAPRKVVRDFDCDGGELTSLKGAPEKIGGKFSCRYFELGAGEWNLKGWLQVLREGSTKTQKLILTLLTPEGLNQEIQKDPAGMITKLKDVWNNETFKETKSQLVFPKGYEQEMNMVGDLADIGF